MGHGESHRRSQQRQTGTRLRMTTQDDRGFEKTELVMWNPQAPNFQNDVNLVERDTCPNGYQLMNPDGSGKKTQYELVELAAHVQTADKFTRATAGSKLQIIADQLKHLQDQARKVLEEARLNALIHKTACNFKKVAGTTYYVYKNRKNPDTEFISMISPQVCNLRYFQVTSSNTLYQERGSAAPEFCGG